MCLCADDPDDALRGDLAGIFCELLNRVQRISLQQLDAMVTVIAHEMDALIGRFEQFLSGLQLANVKGGFIRLHHLITLLSCV